MTSKYKRSRAMVGLLALAAMALAACSTPTGTPHVASRPTVANLGTGNGRDGGNSHANSTTTTDPPPRSGNATGLVDEWTNCMRRHGDPTQADPIIDNHGVINIVIPFSAQYLSGEIQEGSAPCQGYLSAAKSALEAADPVAPPPSSTTYLQYVTCMRSHGIPNFPDPVGDKTDFNGAGMNTNSPIFISANKVCGEQINAPAWWINGWGPPGDVDTSSGPNGGPPQSGAQPVGGA